MDILEFVDHGCNHFISDLSLIIASYKEMFKVKHDEQEKVIEEKLTVFVSGLIKAYLSLLQTRLLLERRVDNTAILVRALDRFHRRLQAMSRLMTTVDFSRLGHKPQYRWTSLIFFRESHS